MRLAWTQPRVSYTGTFYSCRDLEVIPKPAQHPHPPLHQAAAMRDTFATIGTMGLALLVALIGTPLSELAPVVAAYQAAWQAAGHPGQGEVRLRLPVYVATTLSDAQADPYLSVTPYYERLRQGYLRSAERFEGAERTARAAQLASLTYEEVLRERVVFGTPRHVAGRLRTLQQALGLSGIIVEPNVGGGMSSELVTRSMRLFAQEVVPHLREEA
jgi:alkanesulfonate monooxygenase SsuD/methylene tetrahydromethanopterin reductase-like flavin-dependent oxidoreductase (luciferase family)